MSRNKKRTKKTSVQTKKKSTAKILSKKEKLWIAILLVVIFLAYSPLLQSEFINYDDDLYITENPFIRYFSVDNIKHLFTTFYWNQYAPGAMTLMAIETAIFGLNASALKLIGILIHIGNTLLVFYFIWLLFSRFNLALVTAVIFALHPMQVESTGWLAASMKIGPYALFFLGSCVLYLRYLKKKKKLLYWASIFLFLLSCLSKEQAITLSVIILLIDYVKKRNLLSKKLWLEKAPYFLISIVFGIITLSISGSQQNTQMIDYFEPLQRLTFASWTIVSYLLHFLVPVNLSTFYTYPLKSAIPVYFYLGPLIAIGLTYLTYFFWRKNNRLALFGILFFLINLALTLLSQVLSVRDVMMADRYIYLSIIGLGLLLAFGLDLLAQKRPAIKKQWLPIVGTLALVLAISSFVRAQVWQNSITVFTDAIEKGTRPGQKNPYLVVPYNNRGNAKMDQGDLQGALADYDAGIANNDDYYLSYSNRGIARKRNGNLEGALADYNRAISLDTIDAKQFLNRGNLYFETGRYQQAQVDYDRAKRLDPNNAKIHSSQAALYASLEQYDLALASVNEALRLDPLLKDALSNRIKIYYFTNQRDLALREIESYLRIYPGDASVIEVRNALINNPR